MRKWLIAGASLTAVGLTALLAAPAFLRARPAAQQPDEPFVRPVSLPIGQVVLFSSGVGYFQREGSVEGNARVDLSFPVSDINDLIKSMVLRDLDGGHISAVNYDSNAPIERTLKSFAINLTGTPTFADILHQARGEKAEVALANAAAGTLSGTIISVEKHKVTTSTKDVIEQAVLNLWCVDGMRSVKLNEIQRVRFLNSMIDSEFKKALETLALAHDTQKKAVSLQFVGEGKRRVTVGYVIENPIWKTSYRLVLSPKGEDQPYLQGWAVVENPSDEDWKDVKMALVSGRPISFQMDLYQPLYVTRPVVTPELFQGLRPVAYDGRMDAEKAGERQRGFGFGGEGKPGMAGNRPGDSPASKSESFAKRRSGALPSGATDGAFGRRLDESLRRQMELGDSVASAASASKLGDYFQYSVDRPVTLPRQKSALLPIVGEEVKASRVSIYNERVQPKFPLLGLKFKNTSDLHLMQGPITVFEGSNYAGDARIQDIQPNEERLLSYAIDLGMEVSPAPAHSNGRITHLKAVKGILTTTTKILESRIYTAKNRNKAERTLLVEHPVRHEFSLVDSKPIEKTADLYRFEIKVPANQTKELKVQEERTLGTTMAINTQSDDQIRILMTQPVASEKMKAGLKQMMELRWTLEKTRREINEQRNQLNVITNDQQRLRANLKEMPSTAKAYKRYLEKFDQQETEIEKYQATIKKLEETQHTQQKALDDFLAAFTTE